MQPGLIVDRRFGGVNEDGSIFGAAGRGVQEKRVVGIRACCANKLELVLETRPRRPWHTLNCEETKCATAVPAVLKPK